MFDILYRRMMRMGASRPWPDAMETLTGQRSMSSEPLLKYFQPLQKWLEKENKRNGDMIGWKIPSSKSGGISLMIYKMTLILSLSYCFIIY